MKLPLIRKSQARPGIEVWPGNASDLFDVAQPRAMSGGQLKVEQLLAFSGGEKKVAAQAVKIALDLFLVDDGFNAVDCRRVALHGQASALMAVDSLDFKGAVVNGI